MSPARGPAGARGFPQNRIDRLIVNSPYREPEQYWHYHRTTRLFDLMEGRRPAGYVVASPDSRGFDDPGVFVRIPLVNRIRERVKQWRQAGYPGVTGITKRLLDHWNERQTADDQRFFFCQLEAAETLIWFAEAPSGDRVGIEVPGDGGNFQRLCAKMATGSGKTVVMAMVIAWQVLNKVANPQDSRFSRNVLAIAPGLTIRHRLAVLDPSRPGNYYDVFRIVPTALLDHLRQGRVLVRNWHALQWEGEQQIRKKRGVDRRGPKSDEPWAREVLGELARARNLLVINDEAHHAWRISAPNAARGVSKAEREQATKWIAALDRIHRIRRILTAYDFSATPFAPTGKQSAEERLFGWVVSDFGLNDAIESGLVKTPRVVIRDDALPDARTFRSRLYHLYNDPEVKDDLNRRAKPEEPLPDLVTNAYYLLGHDWRETLRDWERRDSPTRPVMITVTNRTETAARIKHAFDRKRIRVDELCDPARILHIDSTVLAKAEAATEPIAASAGGTNASVPDRRREPKRTKKQQAEFLRRQVDTVGQPGQPGGPIQNVISVGMLSEGWDAKTVTHIMGLRAFSSQLLCEQVVGRGLRRTAYDVNPKTGLFEPEHVNIFGIPFTFLPHEGGDDVPPPPPKPKTLIEPVPEREEDFGIIWPNVLRIERVTRPRLSLAISRVETLELDARQTVQLAQLAPVIEGKPDVTKIQSIELRKLAEEFRFQRLSFEAARDAFDQLQAEWPGSREIQIAQLIRIVEQFLRSDRLRINPRTFADDLLRRRLVISLNLNRVVRHLLDAVRHENTERLELVFDQDRPLRTTGDMRPWYTSRPCQETRKSHINHVVLDSTWEASDAFALEHTDDVAAWVKNDHLGFEVLYIHAGVVRKYRPDFLVRLASGETLVLETKGRDREHERAKHQALAEWVEAVNADGRFGRWYWDVARAPRAIQDILAKLCGSKSRPTAA